MEKYIAALKGISLTEWRKLSYIIGKSFEQKEIEAARDIRLETEKDFRIDLI